MAALAAHLRPADDRPESPSRRDAPGAAKLVEAIPAFPAAFPASFGYVPETQTLVIGGGAVHPVSEAAWGFSVSGYRVVHQWLRYRMREGAGRAKSSPSPLDGIRPSEWPARYTSELLELLWVIEASAHQAAEHAALLDAICNGQLLGVQPLD